jgi:hypothetical protein
MMGTKSWRRDMTLRHAVMAESMLVGSVLMELTGAPRIIDPGQSSVWAAEQADTGIALDRVGNDEANTQYCLHNSLGYYVFSSDANAELRQAKPLKPPHWGLAPVR